MSSFEKAKRVCKLIYSNLSDDWDETWQAHLLASIIRTLNICTDDDKIIDILSELEACSPIVLSVLEEEAIILSPVNKIKIALLYTKHSNSSLQFVLNQLISLEILNMSCVDDIQAYASCILESNLDLFESFKHVCSPFNSYKQLGKAAIVFLATFCNDNDGLIFLKKISDDKNILYDLDQGDIMADYFNKLKRSLEDIEELSSCLTIQRSKKSKKMRAVELSTSEDSAFIDNDATKKVNEEVDGEDSAKVRDKDSAKVSGSDDEDSVEASGSDDQDSVEASGSDDQDSTEASGSEDDKDSTEASITSCSEGSNKSSSEDFIEDSDGSADEESEGSLSNS